MDQAWHSDISINLIASLIDSLCELLLGRSTVCLVELDAEVTMLTTRIVAGSQQYATDAADLVFAFLIGGVIVTD
jgi:hypothetical protein